MEFGTKIKELRLSKEYSQAQIAYKLGVERSTVAHWESGKSTPNYDTLNSLAKLFSVTSDYLIGVNSSSCDDLPEHISLMDYTIPVDGTISAGSPIEAIGQVLTHIQLPDYIPRKHKLFALKINGDSMNKFVPDGSIAVFEKVDVLNDGDIAALLLNREDATIKKVRFNETHILLEPVSYNTEHQTFKIIYSLDEIVILGKLVWFCAAEGFKFR